MKHCCPYCGHTLEGTELGIHINTLEDKVAEPVPVGDPLVEQLRAEIEALKGFVVPQTVSDAAQASALTLPHFG